MAQGLGPVWTLSEGSVSGGTILGATLLSGEGGASSHTALSWNPGSEAYWLCDLGQPLVLLDFSSLIC